MALALRRKIVLASENLTLLGFTSRLCSGNHDEQRGSNDGVGLAFPAACVATEGFCAFSPTFLWRRRDLPGFVVRPWPRPWTRASCVGGRLRDGGRRRWDRGSAFQLTDCPKWFERERVDMMEP